MLVLLVGERGPHLRGHKRLLSAQLLGSATLVGPDVVEEEQEGSEGAGGLGSHNSDLGRSEIGSIAGLEGLRTNDVAQRERAGNDGSSKGTLGSTTKVGRSPLCVQ
jgi:hypothetical protein